MPRVAASGRVARSGRVAASGRVANTNRISQSGNPLAYSQFGLVLWSRADLGITLGGTLRATGTSPPAWTISGTPTTQVAPHFEIDSVAAGTALGQATYKWSMNNGTSYVATGVPTAAGPTALGSTGLSVSMAAGPYNADNKWDATVSAWADQSGNANHWTQSTATRQPVFSLAGYGGRPCLSTEGSTVLGMETPSVTFGAHSVIMATYGTNAGAAGFVFVQKDDGANGYLFSSNGPSSQVARAGNASRREVSATWVRDGVRKTVGRTFGGTHVTHRLYVSGLDVSPTNGSLIVDPGSTTIAGALYLGNRQTYNLGCPGLHSEIIVFSSAVPPDVMLALHRGIVARAGGTL